MRPQKPLHPYAKSVSLFKRAVLLLALEEARKSTVRCQHGAVIVKGNEIIATGHNRYKIGESYFRGEEAYRKEKRPTIHAEIDAIYNCSDWQTQLRGASLYVVRVHNQGEKFSYSAPCERCRIFLQKMMDEYGLNRVYYTTDETMLDGLE